MPDAPRWPAARSTAAYTPTDDDARYQELRAEVAARLRIICADMPPALFDELVQDICRIKYRWESEEQARRQQGRYHS
jgi:hypothetical protein